MLEIDRVTFVEELLGKLQDFAQEATIREYTMIECMLDRWVIELAEQQARSVQSRVEVLKYFAQIRIENHEFMENETDRTAAN
jgi:hypothetical protein